ncbi:MAG: alpha/beta fold hydrolase, partial [Promethearchaeia archaeon]
LLALLCVPARGWSPPAIAWRCTCSPDAKSTAPVLQEKTLRFSIENRPRPYLHLAEVMTAVGGRTRFGTVAYKTWGSPHYGQPRVPSRAQRYSTTATSGPDPDPRRNHAQPTSPLADKNLLDAWLLEDTHWIVPDLLGHGLSAIPADLESYRTENQARVLREILAAEDVQRLVCVGHSTGGPLGLELCLTSVRQGRRLEESGREGEAGGPDAESPVKEPPPGYEILGLAYCEGNLIEDDCLKFAGIVQRGPPCNPRQDPTALAAFGRFATALEAVRVARSRRLLPCLLELAGMGTQGRGSGVPVVGIFGEQSRGRRVSSEQDLLQHNVEILYVPGAHVSGQSRTFSGAPSGPRAAMVQLTVFARAVAGR